MSLSFTRLAGFAFLAHLVCIGLSCSLWIRQAWAMTEVLVLVSAKGAVDPAPYELRLRSELRTEGLDALLVNASSKDGELKALAQRYGASGVIEVALGDAEATASVWVSEPTLSLEVARSIRVSLTQRDAVGVLALRAVNLYVGAKLEIEQQRRARQQPPNFGEFPQDTTKTGVPGVNGAVVASPKPKDSEAAGPAKTGKHPAHEAAPKQVRGRDSTFDERFRLGGGVSLMQFTDRLDRRIAPSLELEVTIVDDWQIGLTATGPFLATRPITYRPSLQGEVESPSVSIDQEFLWLDGRYRLRLWDQFDLEPAVGLGVARYGVTGEGSDSWAARDAQTVSVISTLGSSLVWRLTPRVRLMVGVVGLLRWQAPKTVVVGQDERQDITGTSRLNFWGFFGPAWAF